MICFLALVYIFSCCEVSFVSSDTLVVVGAEGVIYPLVAQGVAGVPALIGDALVTIINLESNL